MGTIKAMTALCAGLAVAPLAPAQAQPAFALDTHVKVDQTKLDRYYADPSSPNIAGVWRPVRDHYKPVTASDMMRQMGIQLGTPTDTGLPPGTQPLGYWIVDGKPIPGHSPGGPWVGIPYTPVWQKAYDRRVADNRIGRVYGDPHFDCLPRGAMASYSGGPDAFAITQTPGRVQQIFFQEQTGLRNIYTDGRTHPSWTDPDSPDYEPTPYGHAIGHWEGRTLVVDTAGVDRTYTMGALSMHSSRFHMVERLTRISDTLMDIDIAVDDRTALAKPMSMKLRYALQPGQDFKEETCTNNRNATDANGFVQTLTAPKRGAGWDLPDE